MQHFFGIAPVGLCGGVFLIVCKSASGSVITATEGGIPRVAAFGVSKRKIRLVQVRSRQIKRGTGIERFRGIKGPFLGCDRTDGTLPKR
jgi:hypothetical protein